MTHEHSQADAASFYHLGEADMSRARCQGLACFVARHLNRERWKAADEQSPRVYCLGKCHAAPATAADDVRPRIEAYARTPVVLERIIQGGTHTLDAYRAQGGLVGLEKALAMPPLQVVAQLEASELRGRGGAGFPTGAKWRTAASQASDEKHVVANLDEGDPGEYIDRYLAEDDPFCLLEGMLIAGHAIGASRGWIYVRCEYPQAVRRMQQAVTDAHAAGLLGQQVLGHDFAFEIDVVVGRGSYLCGEETALLNSIEGQRPMARSRPPFTAQRGLWGEPTVVNNAETLACVPWILRNGAEKYAALGIPHSRGTKVVSLNSLFCRPGLYEIDFGISLREIVERIGGGLHGGWLHGLLIGGPLAGVIPPTLLYTKFGFQELRAIGAAVGHGGIVAFDEHTSIPELIEHVFSFSAYESCGKCTPCRLGTPHITEMFRALRTGERVSPTSGEEWRELIVALKLTSLCGLGTGVAEFAESIERHYAEELRPCFA